MRFFAILAAPWFVTASLALPIAAGANIPPAPSAPAALLSETQQAKVREALMLPAVQVSMAVSFTPNNGSDFRLGIEGETSSNTSRTSNKLAEFNALRKQSPPRNVRARAAYYIRLADAANAAEQGKEGKAALNKARTAYETQLKMVRSNAARGAVLANLGDLQNRLDLPQAEATLRRAVRLAPRNATAWKNLSAYLSSKALKQSGLKFGSADAMAAMLNPKSTLQRLRDAHIDPVQYNRGAMLQREALLCANRAVQLAPHDPEVRMQRFGLHFLSGLFAVIDAALASSKQVLLETTGDKHNTNTKLSGELGDSQLFFSPQMHEDAVQLAASAPDDPGILLTAVILGALSGPEGTQETVWKDLYKTAAPPLLALANNSALPVEKRIAAVCAAATLYAVGEQDKQAETTLVLARRIAPNDSRVQELSLISLLDDARVPELVRFLEISLLVRDTPRRRLLLARSYLKQDRAADAEKLLQTSHAVYPNSAPVALGLAVILLKNEGNDASARSEATALLTTLSVSTKASDLTTEEKRTLTLTRTALAALNGNQAEAQTLLSKVDSEDEAVQALRAALTAP